MTEPADLPASDPESLRNAFVERLNAQDLPGIRELMDQSVRSDAFGGPGAEAVLEGLRQFLDRYPRVQLTRGDVGTTPVAAVWMPDSREIYRPVGQVDLTVERGRITYLAYAEQPDRDLVAEEPPGRRVAEWESHQEVDSGEGGYV